MLFYVKAIQVLLSTANVAVIIAGGETRDLPKQIE